MNVPAAAPVAEPLPPAATASPWSDRRHMNSELLAVKGVIGDIAFKGFLDKHHVTLGSADFNDPKVYACYKDMTGSPESVAAVSDDIF